MFICKINGGWERYVIKRGFVSTDYDVLYNRRNGALVFERYNLIKRIYATQLKGERKIEFERLLSRLSVETNENESMVYFLNNI